MVVLNLTKNPKTGQRTMNEKKKAIPSLKEKEIQLLEKEALRLSLRGGVGDFKKAQLLYDKADTLKKQDNER